MFENLSHFYYNRGLELARQDKITAALRNLVKAVSYHSENISAWNLAGLCFYRLGSYKTAEYCWSQSVSRSPQENAAVCYLADLGLTLAETAPYFSQITSLCTQGKYGDAARLLKREIYGRFDLSAGLLNYLGILHILDGRTGAAAECWQAALSIDNSGTATSLYLADIKKRPGYRLAALLNRLLKRK